jgi:hypothetical protein
VKVGVLFPATNGLGRAKHKDEKGDAERLFYSGVDYLGGIVATQPSQKQAL